MKITTTIAAAAAIVCAAPAVFAHSGHTNWMDWSFDWEVKDGAGIAIRDVYYKGEKVLYKGSMPVIRVKYDEVGGKTCGPFNDMISWGNLLNISNCGGAKVCQKMYWSGGQPWLELGVLAGIGKYRLYNVWYLGADGQIQPHLWSRGLHCNIDHQHHPYWRLDADIKDAAHDQAFVYNTVTPDTGWGPGWQHLVKETYWVKIPAFNTTWYLRDAINKHGLWISPGANDGFRDTFSGLDAELDLYRASQDQPWPFGPWDDLAYGAGGNIFSNDLVAWYVAHLSHEASGGPDEWHSVGPHLKVQR